MNKFWMSCVLAATLLTSSLASAACRDDDLACFRRGFLERGREIDSLAHELGLTQQLLKTKDEQIVVLTDSNTSLKGALDTTRTALPAAQRAWYEDGRLWFGVGAGVGVALALLTVFLVAQTLH